MKSYWRLLSAAAAAAAAALPFLCMRVEGFPLLNVSPKVSRAGCSYTRPTTTTTTTTTSTTTTAAAATVLSMFFAREEAPQKKANELLSTPLSPAVVTNTSSGTSNSITQDSSSSSPPNSLPTPPVELVTSDNANFLNMVGAFLVDAFWLNSEHHQLGIGIVAADTTTTTTITSSTISKDARTNLIIEQCADLQEKYGETMGRKLLDSCVMGALDPESKQLLGVATIDTSLLMGGKILEADKAGILARNAVASLGPKERRLYKDASIARIAKELLTSPDTKAVCVLSNLAVATNVRRRGVAKTLCEEAVALAKDWGYDEIHLIVEKENAAARGLYEGRLGYRIVAEEEGTSALRVDVETGTFQEVQVDTLTLVKAI